MKLAAAYPIAVYLETQEDRTRNGAKGFRGRNSFISARLKSKSTVVITPVRV